MKPRPTISTLAFAGRPRTATSLQCRRDVHIRAIAPVLSGQIWHDRSRGVIHVKDNAKSWEGHSKRHASTAAAAAVAPKSQYGRAPPPPAKRSKPTVPAKTTPSQKPTTAVKVSSTTANPTTAVSAASPRQPQVPVLKAKENLNPPPFTYAPDLTVPARGSDQGFLSYIWKAGRSYLAFYKSGVSNVRQTSKLARTLRSQAGAADLHAALTRAQWQVVLRSRKDMLRLPAFAAIFLVFGEWTPLLVMYITPLIPEPCRIPSQVSRDLAKTEKTRHERLRRAGTHALRLLAKDKRVAGAPQDGPQTYSAAALRHANPLHMSLYELVCASARFNCHSRLWDWVVVAPPKFWLMRNVRKRFEYLRRDDEAIVRDGGCQALERREVERACVERGIDVSGKKEEELRRALGGWFGR